MDKSVFRFIWRFSKKQQLTVLLLTLLSFPFLYYSLELPKQIINEAIGGTGFPKELLGVQFDQIPYLFVLCGIFLALVFINGGFKYYINVYRGRLGERMLRRLRYELYSRVLRFRLPRFRRMSQGEIIPMITAEVEPIGGFIGDAFALPAFQGGTLLTYIVFIFIQDPVLGAAAISLYPLQGYLIPKLQRKVNQLGKERVRNIRKLAERVGETVSGAHEIHAHDTANYHLADIADRLATNYDIRYEIYRRKFFIKFLNNFINQLTPFFFYSIGGYLVLQGTLSFGALVAVLAAYKDLSGPWKELLTYYQQVQDVKIKYGQVVEQFDPDDIMPMAQLTDDKPLEGPLPEHLSLANVSYVADDGVAVLDSVSLTFDTRRHTAVIGTDASGKDELMMLLARLLIPTSGRIKLGNLDYMELPEAAIGRRISYVGQQIYMFTDTLRANLYYGLKHRPVAAPDYDEAEAAKYRRRIAEAVASGNIGLDVNADWIDYAAAGVSGPEELQDRALALLHAVEFDEDIYRMGLNGTISPSERPEIAERVLKARAAVRDLLNEPAFAEVVELFDAELYNHSATVAENLLFGTPVGPTLAPENLAQHPYVLQVLDKVGLTHDFLEIGTKMAETMIELFADLPPGHEFFEQFSFISSDELPEFQPLVAKVNKEGFDALAPEDRARLMSLPFKLIPSRHRLGLIDDEMERRLLEARRLFAAELPDDLQPCVEFFDTGRYNTAATLQDNILFGKVRYGQSGTYERVQSLIGQVVEQQSLRDPLMAVGMDMPVGVAGARLSGVQKQKAALVRALLKQPDLLILNEATSALDGASQMRVHENLRALRRDLGLIWGLHRAGMARDFDEVIMLRGGRVAGRGSFAELDHDGGALRELIQAE
jgi:ABC-type multidrug transport system fused ATPase/permease subunit